jgi:WD40 repeat protein
MSFALSETHACAPATTRGRGTLLGAHAGKRLVCYANGKQIVVRCLSDDSATVFYDGHQYPTTVARVSPNGEWVASGDASGVVRIWGLNDDQTLKAEHRVLSGAVDDIQWSADGQRLVACGDGRGGAFARAFLWDSGSSVGDISGATKRVNSVAFRPKRPFRIAAASEDFTVGFFEGPPFAFKGVRHKHGNFANCVRFSDDGALFASVGSDGMGVVYDGATGVPLATLPKKEGFGGNQNDNKKKGHAGSIYACAWSPDGNVLLTVGADKTAKAWDASVVLGLSEAAGASSSPTSGDRSTDALPRLEVLTTYAFGPPKPSVNDMQVGCAFVGDDAVTLSLDGTLNVLERAARFEHVDHVETRDGDAPTMTPSGCWRTLKGHAKPVVALGRLAKKSGSDAQSSETYATVSVSLAAIAIPDAEASVAFRWRSTSGGDSVSAEPVSLGHGGGAVVALASSVDGKRILSVGLDDVARVFFAETNTSKRVCALPGQPRNVAVSKDGAVAAAVCGDEDVAVFLVGSGAFEETAAASVSIRALPNARAAVCVSVSKDGDFVFVGSKDGAVTTLRVSVDKKEGAPDDKTLRVSRGDDDATPLFASTRHKAEIVALACSLTRNEIVASADASRRVFVHDTSTNALTHPNHEKLIFHAARITALAWSPDGKRLASGSLDGSVIVWDPWSSGADRVTIKNAHQGGVTSLLWIDEKSVCTGGFDACVRTWTV